MSGHREADDDAGERARRRGVDTRHDTLAPRMSGDCSRRKGTDRRRRLVAALAATAVALVPLVLAVAGCGGSDEPRKPTSRPGELDTVEVAPPPDARVDVERDVKERRRAESFAGVLPARFPKALPLPPQASLVDQGRAAGGAWIEVLVPRRPAAVRGA
ncbi:MAG TPA: hypothetical protein VFS60_11860, partial [Thermoanaerobaculia bacterium]|nr:hypothetical protein [Thermoanaerobaculia bacterium]